MSFVLVLTMCTGFASGILTGAPGACQRTEEVAVTSNGRRVRFDTREECVAEYNVQRRLGRSSYVYIDLFFDRRIHVNRVLGGECIEI